MVKRALGKGLDALISSARSEDAKESGLLELKINDIEPNVGQPRKNFDDEKLIQLAESIKQHGMVQPIIVRKEGEIFRIVAGERRWRAARIAELTTVPAIVRDASNRQVMEVALIENLQREDLNPIEEAEAYENLIKEYSITQEELSNIVGKSRSAIANSVRLLSLCEEIRNHLINEQISSGHARALLSIEDKKLQLSIAKEIIEKGLSVRETENLVKKCLTKKEKSKPAKKNEEYMELEEKLKNLFGTKVQLLNKNKKGKIMIEYYSNEELERILEIIGI